MMSMYFLYVLFFWFFLVRSQLGVFSQECLAESVARVSEVAVVGMPWAHGRTEVVKVNLSVAASPKAFSPKASSPKAVGGPLKQVFDFRGVER